MQAVKPISRIQKIEPATSRETNDARPTEIRYGWCPFQDINLRGPDGTVNMYVQPHEIAGENGYPVANPFHFSLPKSQLIPFPTFNAVGWALSEEHKDSKGSAMPVQTVRSSPALENIVSVLRVYSVWGFTVLSSLQGLDQDAADRIFRVVQPFEYPLRDLEGELEFGAIQRIESNENIRFEIGDGEIYDVPNLFDDQERAIAYNLAAEMLAGASLSNNYASTLFNESIVSINNRLAGGNGKAGADGLDRYLAEQLGREKEIPSIASRNGQQQTHTETLERKLDFLIDDARARADAERIKSLEAELSALRSGQVADIATSDEIEKEATLPQATIEYGTCGYIKTDGQACKRKAPVGEKCPEHAAMTAEV